MKLKLKLSLQNVVQMNSDVVMVHALIKEENVMDFLIVETDQMKRTVVGICLL